MLNIYYNILRSTWKTFGFRPSFLRALLLAPPFYAFTYLTFFLDRIFFPQSRRILIKNPVFIIGHPRSGTTFLHRLLTQTGDFAVFEAWHLLFPSLTARSLLKPLISYLIRTNRSTIYPAQIGHELTLSTVEEEEVLFLHKLDTQFVTSRTSLGFDDREYPELRFYDQQPESRRKSSVRFFKGCLQRQILYTDKEQIMAKPNYSILRIKTMLEEFPDAKFIYLVRSPYETIPSHLSQQRNVLDHQWGIENIPPDKLKRYFERRYRYNIELYRYFYELQKNGEIPEDRVMVLQYDVLRSDLYQTFEKIVAFTGIKPSNELQQAIDNQAQIQKDYQRKHQVIKLEEFGLTREQIAEDLSFVFEEYGFDKNPEQKAAVSS